MVSFLNKLDISGPILVAWRDPYPQGPMTGEALVLDLSRFADEEIDRAFGIWRDRITRDPDIWTDGWKVVLVREAFRSLIQSYGEDVVQAVQILVE